MELGEEKGERDRDSVHIYSRSKHGVSRRVIGPRTRGTPLEGVDISTVFP